MSNPATCLLHNAADQPSIPIIFHLCILVNAIIPNHEKINLYRCIYVHYSMMVRRKVTTTAIAMFALLLVLLSLQYRRNTTAWLLNYDTLCTPHKMHDINNALVPCRHNTCTLKWLYSQTSLIRTP